ncbi:hypothetical protein bsdtb5_16850 [Anaeromicropila herbilytica]|uniref:Uncharacterized protein n=1 Tax=Anaeromicropila herbilytica TaxID=2785025 RepID=A0A7R7EKC0_9FIRM|nr:hypothetical protein bsdtb5_16850 [Anaeromicropila herbilytica]
MNLRVFAVGVGFRFQAWDVLMEGSFGMADTKNSNSSLWSSNSEFFVSIPK